MEQFRICPFCGRQYHHNLYVCPECGASCRDRYSFQQLVDDSFSRVKKVAITHTIKRLDKLEKTLNKLDEDLTKFLSV